MPSPRLVSLLLFSQASDNSMVSNIPVTTNSGQVDISDLISLVPILEIKDNQQLVVQTSDGPKTVAPITDEEYRIGDLAYVSITDTVQIAHGKG